jgi:hypothetical protein
MNIEKESKYKYSAVELVEVIKYNLQSRELIMDCDPSQSLRLLLLYKMSKVVLLLKSNITKDKIIQNNQGQIFIDKAIIINNLSEGRSNVTPTYIQLMVAEKGEGVY